MYIGNDNMITGDKKIYTLVALVIYIYIYIYISPLKDFLEVFRSSCRKLASVVFESTTTEFRSDTLTDRAMQP